MADFPSQSHFNSDMLKYLQSEQTVYMKQGSF